MAQTPEKLPLPESRESVRLAVSLRDLSLDKTIDFSLEQIATLPQDVTSVPRSCGLMTDEELELTEDFDASGLLDLLSAKKVSAVELLVAFRKRATIAQKCVSIQCLYKS